MTCPAGPECQLRHAETLAALGSVDRLFEKAVARARVTFESAPGVDPFQGLYITPADADRMLAREPGSPLMGGSPADDGLIARFPALDRLGEAFDLATFDRNAIAVVLAPELDLRYERLFGFLQDDVTRRRPTVDLLLNLLCTTAQAKLLQRSRFAAGAPLIRHDLIHLAADANQASSSLLTQSVHLDGQVVRILLGERDLDGRLAPFARVVKPGVSFASLPLDARSASGLRSLAAGSAGDGRRLRVCLWGRGPLKRQAAEAMAREGGLPLLLFDLAAAPEARADLWTALGILFRESWHHNAVLCIDPGEAPRNEASEAQTRCLLERLAGFDGPLILLGRRPWANAASPVGPRMTFVRLPESGYAVRRECWRGALAARGVALEEHVRDALASRFRFAADRIDESAALAVDRALWRGADQPTPADFFAAARSASGNSLDSLARKIEPRYSWEDLVLPADTLAQLREICQRVEHRHRVLEEWGFESKLSLGKGVTALFAGPSGCGKTMAAEIVAREVGLGLYQVDLSGIVSKYIGETEKNLERVFAAAEEASAILFFDEADALFGKRSEVRDSHDRYANIEISYLLQRMDAYDGVAILATNLRHNLDEAFIRRLAFTVHFPFPDGADRRRIWTGIWPGDTPLSEDLDFDLLSTRFKLNGGNIKNIALAAAFFAAQDGGTVAMRHVVRATRREFQKMGQMLGPQELDCSSTEASS